jgi:hypothetical protein
MHRPRRLAAIAPILAAALALPARAAENDAAAEVALQRTLDQPITLTLPATELHEVFNQIAAAAKIPLQVDPACYDLLPYGRTTRIEFDARQSRLRDALEDVVIPLGLQQTVVGKSILIRPSRPLFHIGRRATWEELKLLQDLHNAEPLKPPPTAPAAPAPPAPPAGTAATPSVPFDLTIALRAALDGRKDLLVSFANPVTDEASTAALDSIRKQLPMNPYRALEVYAEATGQVWFVEAGPLTEGPTGGTIRIMSRRQWIERQLDRPVQVNASNEALEKVIADLSHASGVNIVPEPGLFQIVPRVNLASDTTLRRTLEFLAGGTSIAFEVRDDSILLRHRAPGGADRPASDEIIGRIALPVGRDGLTMDLLLRESDLPRELNERRKKAIREYVDALQKQWSAPPAAPPAPPAPPTPPASTPAAAPAPPPATAPATRPAAPTTAPAAQPQK